MARRREPGLSRDRIIETALALIDDIGLEAFSMRRLADRLHVDPMSFYHHIANKAALLDGVVDQLMSEADLPIGRMRWQQWVRTSAKRFVGLAHAHPRAFALFQLRGLSSPDTFRPIEALADALIRGGFEPDDTWEIVLVFSNFVVGVGLGIAGFGSAARISPAVAQSDLMSPSEFPRLHQVDKSKVTNTSVFERGLDALIAGFEAERAGRKRRPQGLSH